MKLKILFLILLINITYGEEALFKVGCFSLSDVGGFFNITNEEFLRNKSATACIFSCRTIFKRFAGLLNGSSCMCGEYYSGMDKDLCDVSCPGKPHQICGGVKAISIYETHQGALGAPQSLIFVTNSENSIHVKWNPPASNLADVEQYIVVAMPIYFFSEQETPRKREYKYSNLQQTAILGDLHAGSKYNISIAAISGKGEGYSASLEAWTKVGIPDKPTVPKILSRTSTSINVELEPVIPSGGPISSYQIVVVDETLPVVVDFEALTNYQAANENRLPYYITAEIRPEMFSTVFTIGDRKYYGKYYNAPLEKQNDYHVLLGVLSTINKTKSHFSESDHSQHESYQIGKDNFRPVKNNINEMHESLHINEEESDSLETGIILGLSIAVGLFGFLLFASVLIYFSLRVYFKKNSRRPIDHQELAVHAQIPNQDYENGFVIGAHYMEDEEPIPDHYRILREKVKIFPHQSINLVADIGIGKFGDVKKGIFLNAGSDHVNALIQRVHDDSLKITAKKEMLHDFDMHIKLDKHQNIVCLLGLLEELSIVSFVFEYETLSMKSHLIESRAVQHYPVYAEKNRRFSTLQEQQVVEIICGVAKGMAYLSSLKIAHGQLCSRNIALRDGCHPKIAGFGLIHHHNEVYVPDYTRWQSPECLRSKLTSCSGDIWSFGCLMWECVTLGGTPYADVRTEEITMRIVRGLRLAQPQYLSDEFYQSMLLCWQNDPDERPDFAHQETLLKRLATDDITPHLLFSLYPSFKYEPYCSHLEFID